MLGKIKQTLVKMSEKSSYGAFLYTKIKYCTAIFLGWIMSEEQYAKWFYNLYTGRKLNLKDPKRFDEKLWWLKLNNRDPMLTRCSDKYEVRTYVAECGLSEILIPQIDVLQSIEELDLKKYNEEIVVKCNHNSGGHIFYNPKVGMSESDLTYAKRRLAYIFKHNQFVLSHEWNYKNIPRKILVEKAIRDCKGQLPLDYKFMCFNGEPKLLFLDLGLIDENLKYNHAYPRNIYDMNFELLPVHETRPNASYHVEKPKNFEKMVEIARILSQPFPHCRVDLYNLDGTIYFGEITFYHGGGCNCIEPEDWDYKMGDWIDLSSPKIVKKRMS